MSEALTGRCLCGDVAYNVRPGFRLPAYACHCSDCQRRTGSAFSEHMLFSLADIEVSGPINEAQFTQPSGAKSTIIGCAKCAVRIYAQNDRNPGFGSLRCGTLDNNSEFAPAAHIWVKSKQPWITLPDGVPTMETQPGDAAEWVRFLTSAA